jgi:DNA-binding transcriptional LysR family regulator
MRMPNARTARRQQAERRGYATCERIFAELDKFERERGGTWQLRGDLILATSDHVARHLLPRPLATLHDQHPELIPRVLVGPAHMLVPSISERRVPFGLFFEVPASRTLAVRPIATFPCRIVVAPSRRKDPAVLARFIRSRELDDPLNRSFPTVRFLQRLGLGTQIRLSSNDLGAHVSWVREGLGVSVLPLFVVEKELANGELAVAFPRYRFDAQLDLVFRKGESLGAEASALIASLRERTDCTVLPSRAR